MFDIHPGAFYPPPAIRSTVLRLDNDPKFPEADHEGIDKTAHLLFMNRRKKVRTILKNAVKKGIITDFQDNQDLMELRPGALSLEMYHTLSKTLIDKWVN